jgi:hypothetical protein
MSYRVRHIGCLAVFGFASLLIGCGPPGGYITYPESGATLEGLVTYGGQPVTAGMVIARTEGNPPVRGFLGDDGHYRLDNVPLGEVQIGVNTAAVRGAAKGKMMAKTQGKAKGLPKITELPPKYGDPAKSGIKTTIQKGPNVYDIAIAK